MALKTITKQTLVPLWHYQCPECGIGDGETGYRNVHDAIYCEVCLEDQRHVRLKRWQAEDAPVAGDKPASAGG